MFGVPAEDRGSLIMYGRMPEAGSSTLFGNFIVFEEPDVCMCVYVCVRLGLFVPHP